MGLLATGLSATATLYGTVKLIYFPLVSDNHQALIIEVNNITIRILPKSVDKSFPENFFT